LKNVSWNGTFRCDNGSASAQWQWSAAAYTQFAGSPTSAGVKPVDDSKLSQYQCSDLAGTPENCKSYVTGGACGGGGSNYTGSYSGTVCPQVGSNGWLTCGNYGTSWSGNGGGWGNPWSSGGNNCSNTDSSTNWSDSKCCPWSH
jgi:hypothetical protein